MTVRNRVTQQTSAMSDIVIVSATDLQRMKSKVDNTTVLCHCVIGLATVRGSRAEWNVQTTATFEIDE